MRSEVLLWALTFQNVSGYRPVDRSVSVVRGQNIRPVEKLPSATANQDDVLFVLRPRASLRGRFRGQGPSIP